MRYQGLLTANRNAQAGRTSPAGPARKNGETHGAAARAGVLADGVADSRLERRSRQIVRRRIHHHGRHTHRAQRASGVLRDVQRRVAGRSDRMDQVLPASDRRRRMRNSPARRAAPDRRLETCTLPRVDSDHLQGVSTMRFAVFVKASKNSEAGNMPSTELLAEMGKFNEELVKAGIMQAGEGCTPARRASACISPAKVGP